MRNAFQSLPRSAKAGLVSSSAAILLWILEHLSDDPISAGFAFSTVPFKLALFAAAFFIVPPLSKFLSGRFRIAACLAAALILPTWLAMLAYLPLRQTFAESFGTDSYRWYHLTTHDRHSDIPQWKRDWERKRPHLIEASLIAAFYAALITTCAIRPWRLFGGSIIIASGAYIYLEFTPLLFGLIVWDYDIFLKGIILDSISLDLSPFAFWYPTDFAIFLYSFAFIFFSITSSFIAFSHCDGARDNS